MSEQSPNEPTINIRNKKTGETKTIPISQAGGFGIGADDAVSILEGQRRLQEVTTTGEIPQEAGDLSEKQELFKLSAESASRALATLTDPEKKVKTGPITTRLQKLGEKIPGAKATPGTSFRSQLAFTRTIVRNALLGGTITPGEAASLEAGLPAETDQEDIIRQKLEDFINQFETGTKTEFAAREVEPPKTIAGLGLNAIKDVQNIVEGVVGIPQLISSMVEDPSLIPKVGKEIVLGTIDEYKNLIAHPLEASFNHPVNTILAVIPLVPASKVGLLKLTGKAGKAGKVTRPLKEVAIATKAIDKVSDVGVGVSKLDDAGRAVEVATGVTKKAGIDVTELAVSQAEKALSRQGIKLPARAEIAAKTYSSAFVVPTKLAKQLKPKETSLKMLEYGVGGGLDDMSRTAATVTGQNGVLTRVTRNAIGDIKGTVDPSKAITPAKNMLAEIVDLTTGEENRILRNIMRTEKQGALPFQTNALDAYDQAKRLEALGHQQLNSSTYLTRNLKAEGTGKAYLAAAEEIMADLESLAGKENILANFKTPEILSTIEQVSPKLAQEFRNAKTLKEIRSLQAPFVRLNRMIDLTEDAANSAFASTGRQIASRSGVGLIGGLVGGSAGPLGAILGAGTGMVFGPPITAAIEALRPAALTGVARKLGGFR